MYKGKNPSALRSQAWIADSLNSLMEQKPFASITVKEITEKCDLSRQTFYKVFDSKEEVVEYKLDKLFMRFLEQTKEQHISSVSGLARLYFLFYSQNEDFINLLFDNNLSALLVSRFEIYLPLLKNAVISRERTELDEYCEAFISAGLVGVLQLYAKTSGANPEQISKMLEELLNLKIQ